MSNRKGLAYRVGITTLLMPQTWNAKHLKAYVYLHREVTLSSSLKTMVYFVSIKKNSETFLKNKAYHFYKKLIEYTLAEICLCHFSNRSKINLHFPMPSNLSHFKAAFLILYVYLKQMKAFSFPKRFTCLEANY